MTLMNQFFCVKLTTNSELVLFCNQSRTYSPNSLIQFSNDSKEHSRMTLMNRFFLCKMNNKLWTGSLCNQSRTYSTSRDQCSIIPEWTSLFVLHSSNNKQSKQFNPILKRL